MHRDDLDAAARGQRLAARRVRRRDEGRGRRAARDADGRAASGRGDPPAMKLLRRPDARRSTSGRCASRASARPRSSPASRTPGRAGRTRPCRPSSSASTCATSRKLARQVRLRRRRSTATSARAASTRASTSTSTPRDGIAKYRALPRRGRRPRASRYGGSLSGEHGDGQSRARAAAEDVRRRAGRRVPRVQGDLGSRRGR